MRSTDQSCSCKIGRNRDKHDLKSLDTRIQEKREVDQASLRDLAQFVNIQILDSILDQAKVEIIGDAQSIYQVLDRDDVPIERRVTVNDQLRAHGIDVEDLQNDFVSYQSIRHHLQNCLGIATDRRGVDSVAEANEVIEWSRDRHETIVERVINRLDRQDVIDIKQPMVTSSSLTISCNQCGEFFTVDEFFTAKQCRCEKITDNRP